jgi:hypothetical protein
MKRMTLAITTGLAAVAFSFSASAALAVDQPPPIPTPPGEQNPWPGKQFDIFFYVETLTASPGESVYGKAAPTRCTQTNFFARGERVVWHISAVNTRAGTIIASKDVKYAYLVIPGMKNIGVTFTPHGRDPATAPWTWTARWDVPLDYPLGVVPFKLVMKLKGWPKGKVATFTQIPIALEQLTIIANR